MEQNQQELTLDESVAQVMQTLPPPIRSYLAQGKYTAVAQSLMAKYGLRIDQGGVLEREIMLLLMGIENPEEFNQALATEANLNQQTISSIVQDVNTQIFSPLREEMRKGVEAFGKKPPQIQSVMPVRQPAVTPAMLRPMSVPPAPVAGAGQPTSHFHLENKLPPPPPKPISAEPIPPRPLQSVTPITKADASVGSPTVFASGPKSVNILSIAPLPPKMVLPRPAVASGVGGPRPMNMPPRPAAETPLQQALRTVLPRPAEASGVGGPPPPNLPGAMPPRVVPEVRPSPIIPKVEPPVQKAPQAPVKPYSADPYREPIE